MRRQQVSSDPSPVTYHSTTTTTTTTSTTTPVPTSQVRPQDLRFASQAAAHVVPGTDSVLVVNPQSRRGEPARQRLNAQDRGAAEALSNIALQGIERGVNARQNGGRGLPPARELDPRGGPARRGGI